MQLFNYRRLQDGRSLQISRSLQSSSLALNGQFVLQMDGAAVQAILPYATQGGDLYMGYSSSQP